MPAEETSWKPSWELCESSQCDFPNMGEWGHSVNVILQRCLTEHGNYLYMAVSTAYKTDEGGVALAVEVVEPTEQ